MINEKVKVLILTTSSPGVERHGAAIAARMGELGIDAATRKASTALIPQLAPYDLIVFGAGPDEDLEKGDYQELHRSCRGVSFAGRWAAFYAPDKGPVFDSFRRMLAETEIRIFPSPLVETDSAADGVQGWCRQALAAVSGGR